MKIEQVKSLATGKLNHEDLITFCRKIIDCLKSVSSDTATKSVDQLSKLVESYDQMLDMSPEFVSLGLQSLDSSVDAAWCGMNAEIENHLEHPNEKVRKAAADVHAVWSRIADPTELPYEDEYARIKSLIAIVSKIPADVMKDAGVDEWFEALKKRNAEFVELWGDKADSDSQRLANQIKKIRGDVEATYGDLVSFINGWVRFAQVDEKHNDIDDEVSPIVDKVNAIIDEYNAMFAERTKNVSKCIEDILNMI